MHSVLRKIPELRDSTRTPSLSSTAGTRARHPERAQGLPRLLQQFLVAPELLALHRDLLALGQPRTSGVGASVLVDPEPFDESLEERLGQGANEVGIDRAGDVVDDALWTRYFVSCRSQSTARATAHLERDLEVRARLRHRDELLLVAVDWEETREVREVGREPASCKRRRERLACLRRKVVGVESLAHLVVVSQDLLSGRREVVVVLGVRHVVEGAEPEDVRPGDVVPTLNLSVDDGPTSRFAQ